MSIFEDINPLKIPGCFELIPKVVHDKRGFFIKTFYQNDFKDLNLNSSFVEEYYTKSLKNVFRGLHFQTPSA